jgi:hypothetical protein
MSEDNFKDRADMGSSVGNFVRDLHSRFPGHSHLNGIPVSVDTAFQTGAAARRAVEEKLATPDAAQGQVRQAVERALERLAKEDEKTVEFESRAARLEVEAVHATYETTAEAAAVRSEIRQRVDRLPLAERGALLKRAAESGDTAVYHALMTDPLGISLAVSAPGDNVDGYETVKSQAFDKMVERHRPEEARLLRDGITLRQQASSIARRSVEELAKEWDVDMTKANEDAMRARLYAAAKRRNRG